MKKMPETLERVHTHTHTHTHSINLINKKETSIINALLIIQIKDR